MLGVDRFGNRWQQNGSQSFIATFTGNNPGNPQNNNRMDGYSYDAAGNLLSDGLHQYKYDAENHLIQVDAGSTATYVYDADGNRVQKTTTTGSGGEVAGTWQFLYDQSGRMVQRYDGTFWQGNIFVGGRHLVEDGAVTNFSHSDWLGTERMRSTNTGAVCESIASLPFGDGQTTTGACYHSSPLHFTGKERDSESGLDYFGARYDSSSIGRFVSPDPVEITPGRLRDPQQLNLYSYVRNNPLRFVDPDGEILQLSGDVNEAQAQLCDIIGGDCSRVSYNDKTNTITVDLTGIDLSQNEGASLINNLVSSSNVYNLALGDTVQTAGGLLSLSGDNSIANLDRNSDDRYSKGKTAKDLPAKGIDDQVGINPKDAVFRDSQGRLVPLSSLIFHELAEAYAKVDGGKAYGDFQTLGVVDGAIAIGLPQQGAHNEAVQRELMLRSQRPYMNFSGRAGDVLIRQPKPPKPQ